MASLNSLIGVTQREQYFTGFYGGMGSGNCKLTAVHVSWSDCLRISRAFLYTLMYTPCVRVTYVARLFVVSCFPPASRGSPSRSVAVFDADRGPRAIAFAVERPARPTEAELKRADPAKLTLARNYASYTK